MVTGLLRNEPAKFGGAAVHLAGGLPHVRELVAEQLEDEGDALRGEDGVLPILGREQADLLSSFLFCAVMLRKNEKREKSHVLAGCAVTYFKRIEDL